MMAGAPIEPGLPCGPGQAKVTGTWPMPSGVMGLIQLSNRTSLRLNFPEQPLNAPQRLLIMATQKMHKATKI